jgi:soluble lytic murein transglycosylase-like protein
MVVHEPAVLPQAAKPAGVDPKKGAPTKAGVKAAATGTAQPQSGPQQPMIIPASSAVHSEMVSTGNPKYDQLIAEAAARNFVDPNLIVAVMRQESGFNARARSYKGATGLMQLMPATASRFGVTNIYDPQQNIEAGARYLRFLLDTFNGDVSLALAGYNAGENAVVNSGFRIPRYRETQNYVRAISARYNATGPGRAPVSKTPKAPDAASFSASRLSNNY